MPKLANAVLLALSAAVTLPAAANRIPGAVDPVRTTVLHGKVHPLAKPEFDRGPLPPSRNIQYASVYFVSAPGLEEFLADQQNPASPNYHRWLTPEQFGDRFGLSDEDTAKVAAWLKSSGLQVHDIARGRQWITFSGTVAQISAALKTEFRQYQVDGETHFTYSTDPSVPAALAPVVAGFRGLDDFDPRPMHIIADPVAVPGPQPRYTSGSTHYLTPDDIATIYNVKPLYDSLIDGTGQKIAVIGRTDINLADIRAFRARYNLAPNDPQVMLYGPDPGTSSVDLPEASLDIEWAGAVARRATVIYVNSTSVRTSAQYAVDQNLAPVMTYSYGACELLYTTDTLRPIAQQGNAQGITWMASTGDQGATTCDSGAATPQATKGNTLSYPASIPEITGVGGTQFDDAPGSGSWWASANSATLSSALSYIPERVWNESATRNSLIGGGGGASSLYSKPVWQKGPGVPADGARDLPDISFSAAVHDAYEVIYSNAVHHVGGTSVSSPVFAGVVTLLNHYLATQNPKAPVGLGNINPNLYRLAQASPAMFHDTTVGDNKMPCAQGSPNCVNGLAGFAAGPGYDQATGLGSLDVNQFVTGWTAASASTTTLTAAPASYAATDTVVLTATVTGSGGVPTGTVTFIGGDITIGSAALVPGAASSVAVLKLDGIAMAAGNGTVGAVYSGDSTFATSGATAKVSLQLPASGSLVVPSVSPNPVRQVGTSWPYTLALNEKAGVATSLTVFTIDGVNNLSGKVSIAAGGSIYNSLAGSNLNAPLTRTFHFEGADADGTTWKRDLAVPFLGPLQNSITPSISVSVAPATVQRNPAADPSCQWQQQLTVRETSGSLVNLSTLSVSGTSMSSQIPALFGTTRLAPWGMLTATICLSNVTAPVQRTFTVSGSSWDFGNTVTGTATASLTAESASPAKFTASAPAVALAVPGAGKTVDGPLDVRFSSGSPAWTGTVLSSSPAKWLTLSATSGSGQTSLTFHANSTGLSNGVYNTVVSFEAVDALPQVVQIPVTLVVGASSDTSITGVGNAASGVQSFAPGQLVAVYGTNLAASTQIAAVQPLPFTLNGTSATVNGVSAPLWFVSPGQINLQLPYETSAGTAVIGINNNGKTAAFNLQVSPAAPGIFTDLSKNMVPVSSGAPGETIFGFITGDGDLTPTLATGASNSSYTTFPKSRQTFSMTVGGTPASVVFNGVVPGLIGVTQVNFTIPASAQPGVNPVVVTVGGVSSAPANITVTAK